MMKIPACPFAQSVHAIAVGGITVLDPRAAWRHDPKLKNAHQAGRGELAVARSIVTWFSLTCESACPSTNDPTNTFDPLLALQAKLRLKAPPSPKQVVHRMFTPGPACAIETPR